MVYDVYTDPAMSDDQQTLYLANDISAFVVVPLLKNGRFVAAVVVNQITPRDWMADEIGLLEEIAEQTWAAVECARKEEELKINNQRKDEFLAMLGYELRNPLAPIRISSEMLDKQLGTRPEY